MLPKYALGAVSQPTAAAMEEYPIKSWELEFAVWVAMLRRRVLMSWDADRETRMGVML